MVYIRGFSKKHFGSNFFFFPQKKFDLELHGSKQKVEAVLSTLPVSFPARGWVGVGGVTREE